MADATCHGGPTSWWFPVGVQASAEALDICETCPVVLECMDFGLPTDRSTACGEGSLRTSATGSGAERTATTTMKHGGRSSYEPNEGGGPGERP